MYLQGSSSPALLCILQPAVCAASDTILTECCVCLQAHTSTTTARKARPTQASSRLERLRHHQLDRPMSMGTRMGHLRPQVGLVCLACSGWRASLAGLQGGRCVCEGDWRLLTGSTQQPCSGGH